MTTLAASAPAKIQSIQIDQLKTNPWSRTLFDPDAMKDLIASIKADGVKEPLLVRPCKLQAHSSQLTADCYEIAAGSRRFLAAVAAGLTEVPCLVKDLSDEEVAEYNLILTIQREEIPDLEIARMVQRYMAKYRTNRPA